MSSFLQSVGDKSIGDPVLSEIDKGQVIYVNKVYTISGVEHRVHYPIPLSWMVSLSLTVIPLAGSALVTFVWLILPRPDGRDLPPKT